LFFDQMLFWPKFLYSKFWQEKRGFGQIFEYPLALMETIKFFGQTRQFWSKSKV
jgi:hypothetical protein